MVRKGGLEPPRAFTHQILNLARLPNSATFASRTADRPAAGPRSILKEGGLVKKGLAQGKELTNRYDVLANPLPRAARSRAVRTGGRHVNLDPPILLMKVL